MSNLKHGLSKTTEYNSWANMKKRCLSKSHKSYGNYGGRGISICAKWVSSFENFLADMGNKPTPYHSLDRIDNNRGYSRQNCRWATCAEQLANRRNAVTFNKESAIDASLRLGGSKTLICYRLKSGWEIERAFNTPVKTNACYNGETQKEASKRLGGNPNLVNERLRKGWETKKAFTTPKGGKYVKRV